MQSAPKHPNENERLLALERLKILDTLPEKDFDDLTLIAAQICDTPIALVSLVDESRQWFKSKKGLDASQTPREFAFCAHTILNNDLFIISDSRNDERFQDNPLVTGDPKVIFYAGAPLLSPDGYPIGTLCVIDYKPKALSEDQKSSLKALSSQISRLLELRLEIEENKLFSQKLEYKRIAVENLGEGVVLQDPDFKIIEFNAAALDVLGLTGDQLTGKTSMDPDWRSIREDGSPFPGHEHPAVVALTTGEKQKNVVMGIHRPNSELRWIEINSTPVFSSGSSTPSLCVTSFSDITFEKTAKRAIERSQVTLTRVLNGVPAMISHWDRNLINLHANNPLANFFRKSAEDIKGHSLQTLLGDDLFEKNYPHVQKVLKGEPQNFERMVTALDGNARYTMTSYLPDIENGEVIGFFVIVNEITEIKRLEMERQDLAAKMVESAKLSSLGEMAGGVAHEVNTPLAIINAKASILLESYLNGSATEAETIQQLRKILLTTERITKIIKGLRLFSRNSENDSAQPISASALVDATLDLCHEKMVQSEIKLITDVDNDCTVLGKFSELSQVIMNLISNSVDAVGSLSEKWIKIQTIQKGESCLLIVTDSGQGIPPKIAEKMMHPFFTTKEIGKGTGLGLSISTGIIKSHGGKFWYDSTTPNTCFVIELPLFASSRKVNVL